MKVNFSLVNIIGNTLLRFPWLTVDLQVLEDRTGFNQMHNYVGSLQNPCNKGVKHNHLLERLAKILLLLIIIIITILHFHDNKKVLGKNAEDLN